MELKLIWAQTLNNVIGINNNSKFELPWKKNKEDLKHFKEKTINGCVLMGYNTYLSLNKKPLNDRHNIVLTSKHIKEFEVLFDEEGNPMLFDGVTSIQRAIDIAEMLGYKTLWIIGGKSLYEECFKNHINKITEIYKTVMPINSNITDNSIIIRDIPKSHFRQMSIEKLDTCSIEFYTLR